MLGYADISARAATERLVISGVLEAEPQDEVPMGTKSLVLLSPDEPIFWEYFRNSPEYSDGEPDPLDRWSVRRLGALNALLDCGGTMLFPFGGPPWRPFISWAKRSGRAHPSPVGLLVHDHLGMFISYRAALALPYALDAPTPTAASPCEKCHAPCRTACPAGAFAGGFYDVPRCKAHLDTAEGRECKSRGCLVRRACPVGQGLRLPQQSAFHMEAFHPDDA